MLGTIGLASASAAFGLYAYSADKVLQKHDVKFAAKDSYVFAYVFASLAAFFWTIGTLKTYNLMLAIFFGDVMLMFTTLLLLKGLLVKNKAFILGIATVLSAALLYFRFFIDKSNAVMHQGILVFNTPRLFGASLLVIFMAIWLTANKRFYRSVLGKLPFKAALEQLYYSSNILALIGVAGFMFAKKNVTITYSFTMLVLSYVSLVSLNFYINHNVNRNGGKKK